MGKGSGDRCKRVSKYARSKDFLDIYYSAPCDYRIVEDNLTDDEACSIEIERIALHRSEENSILTNKTNGGEKPQSKIVFTPKNIEKRFRMPSVEKGIRITETDGLPSRENIYPTIAYLRVGITGKKIRTQKPFIA